MKTATLRTSDESKSTEFENLKKRIHGKLVDNGHAVWLGDPFPEPPPPPVESVERAV